MNYNTNNIDKVLGQKVDSPTIYTPEILVREERQRNRSTVGLQNNNLPFVGYDIWNGYECSCLTDNGLPVTCTAKVVYSATNEFIVESKSMKLYWNSFNMTKLGKSPATALKELKKRAEADLSKLLETKVKVGLFTQVMDTYYRDGEDGWVDHYNSDQYFTLETFSNSVYKQKYTVFNEDPSLLKCIENNSEYDEYWLSSTLLRSNCKITKQPDSGDIFIYYRGSTRVLEESLLEWIVSLRNECHFHEEICETAYKRLWDLLKPKALLVTCFYARRGGWDINPTRASSKKLLDQILIDANKPYNKFPRQ